MVRKLWIPIFLILGMVYFYINHVNVVLKPLSQGSNFSFSLHSHLSQKLKLHLRVDRYKFTNMECNGKTVTFDSQEWKWHEVTGEEVVVALQKGENICHVKTNAPRNYKPEVKVKWFLYHYTILFMLLGFPISYLLVVLFTRLLNHFSLPSKDYDFSSTPLSYIIIGIIVVGLIIRVLYLNRYGVTLFQHDWHGHIAFIKYIAQHWSLPVPDEGLQYPQQPLYYYITAALFSLLQSFGFSEKEALFGLGFLSLFASALFLIYAYRLFRLLNMSQWSIGVAMLFLSLTPSFVYMSARINNDALVMGLASMSLYYLFASYIEKFQRHFFAALISVSLLFMTKISTAGFELLFFILLLVAYLQTPLQKRSHLAQKIAYFSIVGLFLLGLTLYHDYLPLDGAFHFVNSSDRFPGQILPSFWSREYFFSFHLNDLIQTAQSHVMSMDTIRFSLPTYFYGTMLFGEFDYQWFRERIPHLKMTMQALYIISLIFIVGLVAFLVRIHREKSTTYWLVILFVTNLLLLLKFLNDYSVVCNSDFRYFVPSFVIIALIFAKGLESLRIGYFSWIVNLILLLWVVSLLYFYTIFLSL